jgi:hypothetical protein
MPQTFNNVAATDKLQDSLTPLLERDNAARSNNSGSSFPSANLTIGMSCWRQDQDKLYVLKATSPVTVWEEVAQVSAVASTYLPLAGGTVVGNVTIDASAAERQLLFRTGAGLNFTYFFHRPSDHLMGLWSAANSASVWTYTPASHTLNLSATNVLKGGNTIWHAGNDGAGSGLDSDLLDGQHGSYYLNYNNLTNRPTLTDAATTTVAAIRAGVDLASRVAKSGDTMTGTLLINNSAPTLVLQDTDGRSAFLRADGNILYFLGGAANATTFAQVGGQWPLYLNLDTNHAYFGGNIWAANYGWLHDRFATKGVFHHAVSTNSSYPGLVMSASNTGNTLTLSLSSSNCACNCAPEGA